MTEQQFKLLTVGLSPQRIAAAHFVIFDALSGVEAERRTYGSVVNTVGRDVKRVQVELAKAVKLVGPPMGGFIEELTPSRMYDAAEDPQKYNAGRMSECTRDLKAGRARMLWLYRRLEV